MTSGQRSKLVAQAQKALPVRRRKQLVAALTKLHPGYQQLSYLDWLKQSPRTRREQGLDSAFKRIYFLRELHTHELALPYPLCHLTWLKRMPIVQRA